MPTFLLQCIRQVRIADCGPKASFADLFGNTATTSIFKEHIVGKRPPQTDILKGLLTLKLGKVFYIYFLGWGLRVLTF